MADGWVKIWRKITDSDIWLEKPFSKGQAWVDLLLLATASDHVSKYKGKQKMYKEGTVHFSLCFFADRWGWSRNKVYRFIRKLQDKGMIVYQGRTVNGTIDGTVDGTQNGTTDGTTFDTVLTVVNWALYQSKQTRNGTTNGTMDGTTDGTVKRTPNGTHPKNDIYPKKNTKEEKKRTAPSGYPYPCGLWEKPKWMTAEEWEKAKYLSANDIPGLYRGEYDSIIEYLHDKKKGCLK